MDPDKLSEWLWQARTTHPPDLAKLLCDHFVIRQREYPLSGNVVEEFASGRRKWEYGEDGSSG